MADSLSATGGEAMVAGTPLELPVVASVEGDQSVPANPGMPEVPSLPEAAVPEAPGSPKGETSEVVEPPAKRARELSPELEGKFIRLMEQTRKGFEITGDALSKVQEHLDLVKQNSRDLTQLAAELHTNKISEKYYLTQLQGVLSSFGQLEWQLAGPKSEANTSLKSVCNKILGAHTATKEGMKALHQEVNEGHEKVLAALQEGFGTLASAMVKQPLTVRDGSSTAAFPPAPPAGAPPAAPAAPAAPGYGMPGYSSGYGGTPTGVPVMHTPQTPRTPPSMMSTVTSGSAAPPGAARSEAQVPMILVAADEAGSQRRVAVSPTRHLTTHHLNPSYLNEFGLGCVHHQGGYHRRLPDGFLPK